MNSDRIKEIQETTAYPESTSVMLALKQVWNECEQDKVKNLTIPVVSKDERSEDELLAFLKWIYSKETDNLNCETLEEIVKVYMKK